MAVSFAGVSVISLGSGGIGGSLSISGIAMALFKRDPMGGILDCQRKAKGGFDESVKLFSSFLFGSIYLLAGLLWIPAAFDSTSGTLASIYVGAFEMGIPFLFSA